MCAHGAEGEGGCISPPYIVFPLPVCEFCEIQPRHPLCALTELCAGQIKDWLSLDVQKLRAALLQPLE